MQNRAALTAAAIVLPLASASAGDLKTPIDTLKEIAPSISACWHPPHQNGDITIRLSFARSGSLIGRPRITFMKSNGGVDGAAELANSIFAALHDCTPLPFTPALGAAVAGRVMTIRFIGRANAPSIDL